jgi:hypothetical protein
MRSGSAHRQMKDHVVVVLNFGHIVAAAGVV